MKLKFLLFCTVFSVVASSCNKESDLVYSSLLNGGGTTETPPGPDIRTSLEVKILGKWYSHYTQTSYVENGLTKTNTTNWTDGRYEEYKIDKSLYQYFTSNGMPVSNTTTYSIPDGNTVKVGQTLLHVDKITDQELMMSFTSTVGGISYKYTTYYTR